MEKSNTVNSSKIDLAVKSAVKYIKQWSQAELEKLFTEDVDIGGKPLIAQLGEHIYVVGNYVLFKNDSKQWQLNYRYSDFQRLFEDKRAGLLFAIYYQTGKTKLADKLYECDAEVARLNDKVFLLGQRSKQARRGKEFNKYDHYQVRFNEYNMRLQQAKSLLEKNLKMTKYI